MSELEEAQVRAADFTNGLACLYHIKEMIEKAAEAKAGMLDKSLPDSIRKESLRDLRHINQQFNLVATARAVVGISA
tara:strand:+ start:271 stop:501 length:231 start_codon:yes stop_codon:yes gene_type:complete